MRKRQSWALNLHGLVDQIEAENFSLDAIVKPFIEIGQFLSDCDISATWECCPNVLQIRNPKLNLISLIVNQVHDLYRWRNNTCFL